MREFTTVSFPGLGLDAFTLNKIALSLGPIEVRWYGIFVTLGIALAFVYATWRGKKSESFVFDDVIDIGLFTVSLGVIGARLYYVLTTLDEYDYSSLRVEKSKKERVYVKVDATVTNSEGKSQQVTLTVILVEEADGWKIDNPTYANYNEAKDRYDELKNQDIK